MNITPCPTKTSSSIVTPSQMNEWLWILQFEPITAPRCTSTNGPMRVLSPILQPYKFVNAWTTTCSPNSTSTRIRYGASLCGASGTAEPGADALDDVLDLRLGDAREDWKRDGLLRDPLRHRKRALSEAEMPVRLRDVRRLRIMPPGADTLIR